MTSAVCPRCRDLVPTRNSHHQHDGTYVCQVWRKPEKTKKLQVKK